MSLTPKKTSRKALTKLTRALTDNGAGATPITIPARVLLGILDKLQNARFQATNEARRASQNYQAWEELRQELARRTQRAQDTAPTPDELLITPGGAAAMIVQQVTGTTGAVRAMPVDEAVDQLRAHMAYFLKRETTQVLRTVFHNLTGKFPTTRAQDRGTLTAEQVTEQLRATLPRVTEELVNEHRDQAREDERARVLLWLQSSAGNPAVREYARLRARYTAEHDTTQHERADFRTAALALCLRPDMKVAITSNNGREKVNALFSAQALWEGQNLGAFPAPATGPARNDALAAALLMCSLDRDATQYDDSDPQS